MTKAFVLYELFPVVFNMSLTASVIIVFVLVARLALKKAPKVFSYALWSVVLFRLLCPVSFSAFFSMLGVIQPPVKEITNVTSSMEYVPPDIVYTEHPQVDLPVPNISEAINQTLNQNEENSVSNTLESAAALVTLVWLAGVLSLALYSFVSLLRLRRKLIAVAPLRDNIYLADDISSPFVMGVFRPKIYLPSSLSEAEYDYIILHEKHHINRRDYIVRIMAFFALCVHWFNPLVWVSFTLSGKDMEMSCDEAVLKKLGYDIRSDYSASLLRLAARRSKIAGTTLAFGECNIASRIKNLLSWKQPKLYVSLVASVACAIVIAIAAVNPIAAISDTFIPTPVYFESEPISVSAPRPGVSEHDGDASGLYERKENCWTFLLVGMDLSGRNTDSLMLAMYDVDAQSISVATIARDLYVDENNFKKINAAYALTGGMDGLKDEIIKTFGAPIDYYFRVNTDGFSRLVNAVGGVDFDIPCDMDYDDPYQGLSIHYSKGRQHLDGQQVLEVCCFRQNNDRSGYGDEGRQTTQRDVLTAVIKKVLSHPEKINEYMRIASESLETDMKLSEMAWFATKALSFSTDNLHTMSMPCQWSNPYMYLDPEGTLAMVNEYLNPYTAPRTAEMLNIIA